MLSLVNKYGLSHVCADPEFKNIEYFGDGKARKNFRVTPINFPYLDMHSKPEFSDKNLTRIDIEFYLRGTKDKMWEFKNLFEYLYWTSLHGAGKIFSYILKKGKIFKCADYKQTNKKSLRSFEANCVLCLSTLFALEEFKIYEDFIQLSDLVEAQKIFVNRTELSTNGKVK